MLEATLKLTSARALLHPLRLFAGDGLPDTRGYSSGTVMGRDLCPQARLLAGKGLGRGYAVERANAVSGFSTAGSKFLSIVRRAQMVSARDNGIYIGSGLRGVIPYVQCVATVFPSQVCL
jgi:hypothetical protein